MGRPLTIAPNDYRLARDEIDGWLGYPNERRALIIGIDGADGAGKSSLASWLGWQLNMATISLDLFLVPNTGVIKWRSAELRNVINTRVASWSPKPVIVEGILLLKALAQIEMTPHRSIWLTNDNFDASDGLAEERAAYESEFDPINKANLKFRWPKNS